MNNTEGLKLGDTVFILVKSGSKDFNSIDRAIDKLLETDKYPAIGKITRVYKSDDR